MAAKLRKNIQTLAISCLFVLSSVSGCIGEDETEKLTIKIAFSIKDDYASFDENPQKLADYLSKETGINFEIYPISSDNLALEALRFGSADIAFLDGGAAWMGWKSYGLEAMAADMKSDGRTHYNAHAWVLNDSAPGLDHLDENSSTDPFEALSGAPSCHTGWLKSAGMLIPMGFLIGQGYAEVIGDENDIESLRNTVFNHFSENSSIPESGSIYYGYSGALRCLSEGKGVVAFAKDSTVDSYCADDDSERESWCLDRERYIPLPAFGQAPSHPLMYQPDSITEEQRSLIVDALLNLNNSDEGKSILEDILNTPGIVQTDAETHLESYSSLIQHVPGIQTYLDEKY